ncbi:hypothetical protein CAPN001_08850 [Capnocytophaga stomatis]|nr:hypothetical protein CAPN001_08850 [Capnocytophaga stomatis]
MESLIGLKTVFSAFVRCVEINKINKQITRNILFITYDYYTITKIDAKLCPYNLKSKTSINKKLLINIFIASKKIAESLYLRTFASVNILI